MKFTDSISSSVQAACTADHPSPTGGSTSGLWGRIHLPLLRGMFLLAVGLAIGVVHAQATYPGRMITIVVPYPAGGTTDMLARSVADVLRRRSGQNVVVDNQPGAGGSLAGRRVIGAAPDGYTLLMTSSGINSVVPTTYKDFKPIEGLTQVSVLVDVPFVMVVNNEFPAKTLGDFLTYAKKASGQVSIGNVGLGSHGHLAQLLFSKAAGVDFLSVPYKGSTPAINDLLGGQINAILDNVGVQKPFIDSHKVTPLFVTSARRSPALPQVPTAVELGLPFESIAWFGLAAPRATSPAVVQYLRETIFAGFQDPEQLSKLTMAGLTPVFSTSAQANARAIADTHTLSPLAAALNLPAN